MPIPEKFYKQKITRQRELCLSSVAILAQVEVEGSIALAYAARSVFGQLSFGMAPKAKGKAKGKGKGYGASLNGLGTSSGKARSSFT